MKVCLYFRGEEGTVALNSYGLLTGNKSDHFDTLRIRTKVMLHIDNYL